MTRDDLMKLITAMSESPRINAMIIMAAFESDLLSKEDCKFVCKKFDVPLYLMVCNE